MTVVFCVYLEIEVMYLRQPSYHPPACSASPLPNPNCLLLCPMLITSIEVILLPWQCNRIGPYPTGSCCSLQVFRQKECEVLIGISIPSCDINITATWTWLWINTVPQRHSVVDTSSVTVNGTNFYDGMLLGCKFGNEGNYFFCAGHFCCWRRIDVPGQYISQNSFVCQTPPLPAQNTTVQFKLLPKVIIPDVILMLQRRLDTQWNLMERWTIWPTRTTVLSIWSSIWA